MPFIKAVTKFTSPNGKVYTGESPVLSVNKIPPLNQWIIRVEPNWTSSTHFELNEPVIVPRDRFVQIYPILRSEINKTQTDDGLHLAALRFRDTLVNGRSVKAIAYNEIFDTWKFASNLLNIVSLNTDNANYGDQPLQAVFKQTYGPDISCVLQREGAITVYVSNALLTYEQLGWNGSTWTNIVAGYINETGVVLYNAMSFADNATFWEVGTSLFIPAGSPARAAFDKANRVVMTFLLPTGESFRINYLYYQIRSGGKEYRNDQYGNLNGFQGKIRPFRGKVAQMHVQLYAS